MARKSYCINTLTRMQMIQYICQATEVEVQRVKNSLEEAIERTKTKRELVIKTEKMESSIKFLSELLVKRRQQLANSQDSLTKLENEIFEVNTDMSNRLQNLKEEINRLLQFRSEKLVETKKRLDHVRSALIHRRRVLAKELFQDIYRIIPFPDSRGYSICGIYLPDAEHIDEHDSKMISIALGYVTHLLSMLSSLLDINLNYQLVFFGSRSLIIDPNNQVLQDNEKLLPLHARSGRNVIFFKYGLYLLNRTIGYIRRSVGIKTPSVALTLGNLYTLFTECLLVDNYNVNSDQTLNRFTSYSPSFDLIDPALLMTNSNEAFNQHFLNDINFIKDNDCMNECLWKEVEALTMNVALNRTDSTYLSGRSQRTPSLSNASIIGGSPSLAESSSSNSSANLVIDEIKRNISKQKQRRRTTSTQRLSQITSSLSSSYASASSTASTQRKSPSESVVRQPRITTITNLSYPPESPSFSGLNNPLLRSNARALHLVATHRRIRSVSGYSQPSSMPASIQASFLHPDPSQSSDTINQSYKIPASRRLPLPNQLMSGSLDKGLNQLMRNASFSSITSSLSNNSESVNVPNQASVQSSSPSSYLNVEMFDIRYGRVFSEENRSLEESTNSTVIPSQPSSSWLHPPNHTDTANQKSQSLENSAK